LLREYCVSACLTGGRDFAVIEFSNKSGDECDELMTDEMFWQRSLGNIISKNMFHEL
jgi:hypothetical protein